MSGRPRGDRDEKEGLLRAEDSFAALRVEEAQWLLLSPQDGLPGRDRGRVWVSTARGRDGVRVNAYGWMR
jgi:hypothetical protein